MPTKSDLLLKFPKRFLWGAGSSAHQIEGGNHNQWSVWELENAKILAETAKYQAKHLPKWNEVKGDATNPGNYVSGHATDHYRRYPEDFALLKKLNLNAWRFSIEWSRIEPEEGAWDAAAIEHYRTYLRRLQHIGIEPIVTLWHWTNPVWFEAKGGFSKRRNVKYYLRYVAKILEELGRDFRYIITINEPDTYVGMSYFLGEFPPQVKNVPKMLWVTRNLLVAHKKAYRLAKRLGRKYKVSLTLNMAHHYAGDDSRLSRLTAGIVRYAADYFMLDRVKRKLDFIGLNFYFSHRYYGYRMHDPAERVSDLGWNMEPANIEIVLKSLADRYDLPIIITENGVADRDDEYRQWWLTQTLMAMHRALQSGVKLEGYLHWSLTDNFEWSSGFWPRFGLAAVDYKTKKRTLRPSAIWFGRIVGKLRQ